MKVVISSPRRLFLIDALGAVLSFFLLGVLLPRFESVFGMPKRMLYCLALLALIFAIYSFYCYFKNVRRWRLFLKIIAVMNLAYCLITLCLVIYYSNQITHLGFVYFFMEIVVIVLLALFELKVTTKAMPFS